ncbi:hypothetical protein KIPB_016581, partial [Kipferlia bialata]|eukprot:g16581.t1
MENSQRYQADSEEAYRMSTAALSDAGGMHTSKKK